MTSFVIVSPPDSPQIAAFEAAMDRAFPGNNLLIGKGQYVATSDEPLTSREVAVRLGNSGEVGQFAAFMIAGHDGWHLKSVWEWMTARGVP